MTHNLDCWPLFISPLGFLLYPRYAIHVLGFGSEKSSIATHISTCFLVNFAFWCFLCLLICVFHVLLFISLFQVFSCFSFLFIVFPYFFHWFLMAFHFCSFVAFFLLKKTLPIQTTCISIHCWVLLNLHMFMHYACAYICVYAHTDIYIYIRIHTCVNIHIIYYYIYIYIYYIYIYYIYIMYIYKRIYVHIYTCIHV